MQMDEGDARLVGPVTGRSTFCAFRVANAPDHGFVANVYGNAVGHEMPKSGLGVVQQRGSVVFFAAVIVEDQAIVKRKVVGALRDGHVAQCRNDLRATGKPLCLRIGFGRPKVEIRHVTPSRACSLPSLACSLAQA
jgi:GxxExxY protein